MSTPAACWEERHETESQYARSHCRRDSTETEKVRAAKLVLDSGADFIKTCTGFGPGRATLPDIGLIKETVGAGVGRGLHVEDVTQHGKRPAQPFQLAVVDTTIGQQHGLICGLERHSARLPGTNPFQSEMSSVPAREKLPLLFNWSNWPKPVPPTWIFRKLPLACKAQCRPAKDSEHRRPILRSSRAQTMYHAQPCQRRPQQQPGVGLRGR